MQANTASRTSNRLMQAQKVSVNPVNASGVGVSSATLNLLSTISHNADNNITGWSWSDGKARTITYDSFGLIASYSLGDPAGVGASAGELRTLVRDAAGRITGYTHTNSAVAQPSLEQTFGYDNLNRLLSATLASSSTQYSYDANGNRTAKTVGATSYANTIAATSNRLVQTQDVGGTAIVQHDSAGNIVSDGTNSFTYSDRGRMSSATNAGGTVNYLYNALELRVAKSGPGALVPTGGAYYVYNEAGQLLGEYDANQTPIYETVYLGHTPVGVMKQTGTPAGNNIAVTLYNVHADHLATARIITRQADQAIVWRWDTAEAFGGSAADQNPNGLGTFVYNPRFPGQVFDAETGLLQNWHREYDPRQGRYRQSDPIGLGGGINTYAYVSGNPLSYVDPYGLRDVDVYIWRAEGSSVGHVMVTEANSTQVILSQFPSNGYPLGPNKTKSFPDTMAAEGRSASEIWRINVPNDKAFDAAAARERGLKRWSWSPSDDSTQCSTAASRALKAGGVGLNTITTGTLMPGFLANGLKATPGIGVRLP